MGWRENLQVAALMALMAGTALIAAPWHRRRHEGYRIALAIGIPMAALTMMFALLSG